MKLRGDQIKRINKALLSAYTDQSALKHMVRFELDENLNAIAQNSNLKDMIFDLVNWAETNNRIEELITSAYRQNPGNVNLQVLANEIQSWILEHKFSLTNQNEQQDIYIQDCINNFQWRDQFYFNLKLEISSFIENFILEEESNIHVYDPYFVLLSTYSQQPSHKENRGISLDQFIELISTPRIILEGDPGSGKTTLLRHLVYECAVAAYNNSNKPLPLYANLGEYHSKDFLGFLNENFNGLSVSDYLPNNIILILDGFDETPQSNLHSIDLWLERNMLVPVIISSRKQKQIELKSISQRVGITPLSLSQIFRFINRYFTNTSGDALFWQLAGSEALSTWKWYQKHSKVGTFESFWSGDDKVGFTYEVERKYLDKMRQDARNNQWPGLLGLTNNLYTLQMLLILIIGGLETKSQSKTSLFDKFVDSLFVRSNQQLSTSPRWMHERLRTNWLSLLAHQMLMKDQGTSVEKEFVFDIFRSQFLEENPDELIHEAVTAKILEVGRQVRFTHHQLQEYFAANQLLIDISDNVPASNYWQGEEWWKIRKWDEVALFATGASTSPQIVINWIAPVNPSLAYRCATSEGVECSEEQIRSLYVPQAGSRISPEARAAWGNILAKQGDTRVGVGLSADGLPDFEWCEIPEGPFIFGGETSVFEERQEYLSKFYISKYQVTYLQFQSFVEADDGFYDDRWWFGFPSMIREPGVQISSISNRPCVNVSWYDATAFCRWANFKLGYEIRLPTELEWEKAARGTDGRLFPWGNKYIAGYANVREIEDNSGPYWLQLTTAVGMYPQGASPYDVLDMYGNVWEWCFDEYDASTVNHGKPNSTHVQKGGGYFFTMPTLVSLPFRDGDPPGTRLIQTGFRVVSQFIRHP